MKLLARSLTLAALLALAPAAHAADPFLWYNGDFDGNDGYANAVNGTNGTGLVYEDFNVPAGETWTVTGLYADVLTSLPTFSQANWEIRTGISAGNGGTLIASGTSAANLTPAAPAFGFNQFLLDVNASAVLTTGTYWLNVVPIHAGSGFSFVTTTSGANAVGTPAGNNGNSFVDGPTYGVTFAPVDDPSVAGFPLDFSYGVRGLNAAPVPEPGSVALLIGAGIGGIILHRRTRK